MLHFCCVKNLTLVTFKTDAGKGKNSIFTGEKIFMKATIHKCECLNNITIISSEDVELPKRDRLKFMQDIVGGLIDIYHHNGRDLVVNDEGILLGLPLNPWAKKQKLNLFGSIIEVHGVLK